MTARPVLTHPPKDPPLPPLPPAPHPSPPLPPAPRTARAELDRLTGPLPAGAAACARWGQALVDGERDGSDLLAESRRVARRVANLLTEGGRDG